MKFVWWDQVLLVIYGYSEEEWEEKEIHQWQGHRPLNAEPLPQVFSYRKLQVVLKTTNFPKRFVFFQLICLSIKSQPNLFLSLITVNDSVALFNNTLASSDVGVEPLFGQLCLKELSVKISIKCNSGLYFCGQSLLLLMLFLETSSVCPGNSVSGTSKRFFLMARLD